MLPKELIGPVQNDWLNKSQVENFVSVNSEKYPHLDPAFLAEICFQHPHRFNENFPNFDPQKYKAIQRKVTVQWVYDNLRYDENEELNHWYTQFDTFPPNVNGSYLKDYMVEHLGWPKPPVIVEAELAMELGVSAEMVGKPYYLIEGMRRTSYARRMMELGLLATDRVLPIIEIQRL